MPSRVLDKVASIIGGYDMFISYRHNDKTKSYAIKLEEGLKAAGLNVFRDESAMGAGVATGEFARLACSARTLIVLVAPGVFDSDNVKEEVSAYLRQRMDRWHRRPFSRIVSINVEQTLSHAPIHVPEWKRLSDYVYLSETAEALDRPLPSGKVIKELIRAGSFVRSWHRFVIVATILVLAIFAAAAGATVYFGATLNSLSAAELRLDSVRVAAMALERSNHALGELNDSLGKSNSALQAASEALELTSDSLRRVNGGLVAQNGALNAQSEQLRQEAAALLRQTTALRATGGMLQTRISAMNHLSSEPQLAYYLAVEAYQASPDPENRELIMASLSRLDLTFMDRIRHVSVEDAKRPYILLGTRSADGAQELSVYDVRTSRVRPARVRADSAWIVPFDNSWRIVGSDPDDIDGVVTYQLWDSDGRPVGVPVRGRGLGALQFIDTAVVRIALAEDARMLLWDLRTDRRTTFRPDSATRAGHFLQPIRNAVATRRDGVSAVYADVSHLALVDAAGRMLNESQTRVTMDLFMSRARWSADERYLALHDGYRKSIGVWDPATASFVRLDPDGWLAEASAWSDSGHLLAFAGRTENNVDVTITVVDPSAPVSSRKVVYRGTVPVDAIAFLPGGDRLAIGDREGNLFILRIADGAILSRGSHQGINRLFTVDGVLYSASSGDLRVWNSEPSPARHWSFQSAGGRVYAPRGAADTAWTWLAVPYVEDDTVFGVELRGVWDGERRELAAPASESIGIEFSSSGRWLVLETFDTLRIFDLPSRQYHDFPLLHNDAQYFTLAIRGDTVRAQVLSRESGSNSNIKFDYVVVLESEGPIIVSRMRSDSSKTRDVDRNAVLSQIAGWEHGKLYMYQNARIGNPPNTGWAYFAKHRDQALGARDSDVQFLPIDLEKLMRLYVLLLAKPRREIELMRPDQDLLVGQINGN